MFRIVGGSQAIESKITGRSCQALSQEIISYGELKAKKTSEDGTQTANSTALARLEEKKNHELYEL